LWDPVRRSDWRATLVAVTDQGESRYGTMWNGGTNSITLAADENRLFLAVAATPDFMPYNGFSRPLISDLPLQPQAYEVAFVNTKATAYESRPAPPAGVPGKAHANGGGFVADTAKVEATAYVGPGAMVLGRAKVLGKARIEDYAVVMGNAQVRDNARISGHALVKDNAQVADNGKVRDWATVQGNWKIHGNGKVLERAYTWDRGQVHGDATIRGNAQDFGRANVQGYAIKDGDCSNGANVDRQVLMCWVWGTDQKYADSRPDSGGLYCNYTFERDSPVYALDKLGAKHGYLMGGPGTVTLAGKTAKGALALNGKDQYVELARDVADFRDITLAVWVRWAGGPADQRIFHFGDGGKKYVYLTPKDAATGKARFVISTSGRKGEQALAASKAIPAGVWTHVAVTLKGDTGTLYVDGKAVATGDSMTLDPDMVLAPNTLAGNNCTFLGRGDKGNFLHALVTDFRIYVQPQAKPVIAALAGGKAIPAGDGHGEAPPMATRKRLAMPPAATREFLVPPTVAGEAAVVMSAPKGGGDGKWVEYAFTRTAGGARDSGWISTNRWTDCGLERGKTYAYSFRMRDRQGNQTPASAPASVTIPKDTAPPTPAEFALAPVGISDSAIRMVAEKANDACELVEYRFTRDDGKTSGWQAGRAWVDKGLTAGAKHSYTVQARDGLGNTGKPSVPARALARDGQPPARYAVGEWQSLPYATLSNCAAMRAMSVTGRDGCPKIEKDPVEYFFQCVRGGGPDSGWIATPFWKTRPLADGTYVYRFKIRDKSPQQNETPYSSARAVAVSARTGYHEYPLRGLAALPEGTLVTFRGKVTAVAPDHYTVTSGAASIRVRPRTVADATDAKLKGRDVTVRGCLWNVEGRKCVTWAELK